jgi:hypothetical protein
MKKLSCFLENFEHFGMFIGCSLLETDGDYKQILKSVEFYNRVSESLNDFLQYNDYTRENLEKWFGR